MRDSRLGRAMAFLDDARELLVDIVDDGGITEGATIRDFNNIDSGRQFINAALIHLQHATTPEGDDAA